MYAPEQPPGKRVFFHPQVMREATRAVGVSRNNGLTASTHMQYRTWARRIRHDQVERPVSLNCVCWAAYMIVGSNLSSCKSPRVLA